jgi:hypothetical protein
MKISLVLLFFCCSVALAETPKADPASNDKTVQTKPRCNWKNSLTCKPERPVTRKLKKLGRL